MKKEDKKINNEENLNAEFEAKILELEKQINEEKNAKLMAMADFQNYKKRLENDKNDYRIFATKMILTQLMQIIDDFDRAIADITSKLVNDEKNSKEISNSLKMLQDKMSLILTQNGFEEIEIKIGDKFDPNTMEALSKMKPQGDQKEDTVIFIDQKGYKHIESNIVIKSAKVIIAKN